MIDTKHGFIGRGLKRPAMALAVSAALSALAPLAHALPCDNANPAMCRPALPSLQATIAARQHYFGLENVDATTGEVRSDLVLISWLSNTTYAASVNGEVMLLDSYLHRREAVPGRTPTTLDEMVAVLPAYIFVSKASPGHADLAANIAFRTGATVLGTQEHCDVIEADARRQFGAPGQVKLLDCKPIAGKNASAGNLAVSTLQSAGVCVRAVTHIDTSATAPDTTLAPDTFDWSVGNDVRDLVYWPPGTPANDGVGTSGTQQSPAVMYHFAVEGTNFAFAWNASAGPIREKAPAVAGVLAGLPKTDVMLAALSTENAANNGMRDPASYVNGVRPKVLLPGGYDAYSQLYNSYSNGEYVKRALEASMTNIGMPAAAQPEVRFLFDPTDYSFVGFMSFDPSAAAWSRSGDRAASASCK
jgi:hypothetical protein